MDYSVTAKQILEHIGGEKNVASVTHCMTRLRFVLKDESGIDDGKVKAIPGVVGVMRKISVSPSMILRLRKRIREIDLQL